MISYGYAKIVNEMRPVYYAMNAILTLIMMDTMFTFITQIQLGAAVSSYAHNNCLRNSYLFCYTVLSNVLYILHYWLIILLTQTAAIVKPGQPKAPATNTAKHLKTQYPQYLLL